MKKLLVFVFAVTLLASCSKILPGEISNRLEGHWVDEQTTQIMLEVSLPKKL